jgi:hypothetical protein
MEKTGQLRLHHDASAASFHRTRMALENLNIRAYAARSNSRAQSAN